MSYAEQIVAGIEGCESLILLATASAISSVLNELEQAHKQHKAILTVMVGKPRVSRALDYYIARLHWIESAGTDMDDVVRRLADALRGGRQWSEVATAPTLGRRITYMSTVMLSSLLTVALVSLIFIGLIVYETRHVGQDIARDYRSLGWVTFGAATERPSQPAEVEAQVWMGDPGTPFQDVSLVEMTQPDSEASAPVDLSPQLSAKLTSGVEILRVKIPDGTRYITTCLTVPSTKLGGRYTVTQRFAVSANADVITVSPAREPVVTKAVNQAACI
jgi:hypothetical protein